MRKKSLIMLDLDGTIIDTSKLLFEGIPAVARRHLGVAVAKEDILKQWGCHAREVFSGIMKKSGTVQHDTGLLEELYADFCRYYNANHNRVTETYPGVRSGLTAMRKAGFQLGVVTTRPSERSAPVLKMDWVSMVDFFVWGDTVERNKPSPDGIDYAMKTYSSGASGVYAGDTPQDIKAAKASEYAITSVGAMWGTVDRLRLADAEPHFSFKTFADFSAWAIHDLS